MQEKTAGGTPAAPIKLDVSVRVIEPVKNLMGFASVKFNDCFVVENLKIVQGSKGLFLGMPSQPDGKGGYRDMVYPMGFASVKFNDCFVVENLKIVQGSKGLFLGMPSQPDGKGGYRDMVYPVTKEFREQLNTAVLQAYEAKLEQMAERGSVGRASISDQLKAGKARVRPYKTENFYALLSARKEAQPIAKQQKGRKARRQKA